MQINGPGSIPSSQPVTAPQRTHSAEAGPRRPHFLEADQLDISREADMLSRARETTAGESTEIRQDKVNDIRAQLDAGTYETPEKLDAAVNRLLDELA
ncbi:MAG TPA: flagellar biosynthesis anti-sigma factor FlgM [Bryobacterales bacterium]|nr:flagellar biosynthesis anti-sigma factor FlgM [Bryobacterales bacterium]